MPKIALCEVHDCGYQYGRTMSDDVYEHIIRMSEWTEVSDEELAEIKDMAKYYNTSRLSNLDASYLMVVEYVPVPSNKLHDMLSEYNKHINKLRERDSKIQERREKARILREEKKREKELELYNKLKRQFEGQQS